MSPSCARPTPMRASRRSTTAAAKTVAGRDRGGHRRGTGEGHHALGRRAHPPQGHQIGAAACHRGRARLLARRGGLRGGRDARAPRRRMAASWCDVDYEELPAVTDAETALDAGTPVIHPELGDNLTFERVLVAGDPDKGFADADAVVETTFVFGRHTGVTNEPRAIVADWNPGDAAAHRLSRHAGAAHDAEPVRQASRARRASGARPDQGRRRLVRHQGAHLCRRDGDGRAVETAQASGQVRRRPHRELRHRHPCARSPREGEDRRQERRHASPRGRSTTLPASVLTRSIRAPRASRPTRSSTSPAGPIPARTTAPAPAWCSRTRTSCASTARSAIRSRPR